MKKLICFVLLIMCISPIVLANNIARITELKQDIVQMQSNLQRARQAAANFELGIVQRQAIIGELEMQDKVAEKAKKEGSE